MSIDELLITCEHGGNTVPARYRHLFEAHRQILRSHRGWDPGTLELGRLVSRRLKAPLIASAVTRLLIDLNRPLGHPRLFSEITRTLSGVERERIAALYHAPHWTAVRSRLGAATAGGRTVLHLALHSFTPVWQGVERDVDVGVLYDPSRSLEREWCRSLRADFAEAAAPLRIRANQPYRGSAPGLTTSMRREFGAQQYLGVELELSQRLLSRPSATTAAITEVLLARLRTTCTQTRSGSSP